MKRITVWIQEFTDRPALQLQWVNAEGQRKTQTTGTAGRKEAERQKADLEYELNHGLHVEPVKKSWGSFREEFEREHVSPLRRDTRDNFQTTLDLFEEIAKPTTLASINERTISTFAASLRERKGNHGGKAAPGTVKVRLQFLRTALRWAVTQKMIPACPRFPKVKVPKKKPQPVAVELFERLSGACTDQQMRVYLLCAWLAGLRLNEALLLSWEEQTDGPWLAIDRERIILPAEFVKADEDQWVPLDPVLADAILALPRHGERVFNFTEDRSGKPITDIAVSARVRELAQRAGVRLTYRSLRRGFGCRYAGKVPAQVLQKLMRHSNITVTMDYYANVDDAVEEAVLGKKRNARRNRQGSREQKPA